MVIAIAMAVRPITVMAIVAFSAPPAAATVVVISLPDRWDCGG